jgi:hypothetical protein
MTLDQKRTKARSNDQKKVCIYLPSLAFSRIFAKVICHLASAPYCAGLLRLKKKQKLYWSAGDVGLSATGKWPW